MMNPQEKAWMPAALAACALLAQIGSERTARAEASAPTYTKDIAKLFQDNCQNCHRPGVQFTPMSLASYDEIRPWVKSIKQSVQSRKMPPWHADPAYGKFRNDLRMKDEDIAAIVSWVDAGAPQGDPADMPPPREWAEGWQIGKPDVVLDIGQDFHVPSQGILPYQYFIVDTNFDEDKYISAMEVRAGNLDVVHHGIVMVRNPKPAAEAAGAGEAGGDGSAHRVGGGGGMGGGGALLGALSPGNTPSIYPPGQGKLIKKGAQIVFQLHYNTAGYDAVDRTSVGFIFQKGPVEKQVITDGIGNFTFKIPPQASHYEVTAVKRFPKDVTIRAFMPHMHYRGVDFSYTAILPDDTEVTLLSIPKYDFEWQVYYYPEEPIKLPAKSRIRCVAHFNNTPEQGAGRPNYNPDETVKFGEQSFQEMMIGFMDYTVDSEDLRKPAGGAAGQ